MIIRKMNEPLNFTKKKLYNNTGKYCMLDFIGQSTKMSVFNFIAYFSRTAMFHLCHSGINFTVNVKYYKVIGATSLKFHLSFLLYTALRFRIQFIINCNYTMGMVLPAVRLLPYQRQNKNHMYDIHINFIMDFLSNSMH
jgi:hypothetical protein